RRHLALAQLDLVRAAGDLVEDGLVRVERVAALIHIADRHRLAHLEGAGIGLFRPSDHLEQRRLAGAVRTDDADNPAARQREVELLDEQVVAERFLHAAGLYDEVAETRAWGDVDFRALDLLRALFAQQLFVRVEARLAFRLARAG